MGAELLHADGQTDRHDELIASFRNFAKAPTCAKKGNITKQKQKQILTKNILIGFRRDTTP